MGNRVLFIVSHLSGGGAEHVARKNMECISAEADYEVAVLTCDSYGIKVFNDNVFIVRDCLKSKSFSLFYSPYNYKLISNYLNKFNPNIIHIHDFIAFSPALLNALTKFKRNHNCKIIMTHHTYSRLCTNDSLYNYSKNQICEKCIGKFNTKIIQDNCAGNRISSIGKYIQKKIFAHYWAKLVDVDISPSKFLMEKLIDNSKILSSKIIYNPCIEFLHDLQFDNRENSIIFFGRVNKEKNIIQFAKMFLTINSKFKLVIIGRGNCENELLEIVKNNDKIEFICDFLNTEVLNKIIVKAKYFVLPSIWYENSPVSIIEAVNAGLVPIVSNIGGMQELVNYLDVGYTFTPSNENELKGVLDLLDYNYLDDIKKLQSSRKKMEVFLVNYYKERILEIYNEK